MEVIKHGNPDRIKQTKLFECKECGCIFKANIGEYRERYSHQSDFRLVCTCPDCNSEADEVRISLNADKQTLQTLSPCSKCPAGTRQSCTGCAEYNNWKEFMEYVTI